MLLALVSAKHKSTNAFLNSGKTTSTLAVMRKESCRRRRLVSLMDRQLSRTGSSPFPSFTACVGRPPPTLPHSFDRASRIRGATRRAGGDHARIVHPRSFDGFVLASAARDTEAPRVSSAPRPVCRAINDVQRKNETFL